METQQEKLRTVRQLIEDALGALHVNPQTGKFLQEGVDVAVGKLIRAKDEIANSFPSVMV